MTTPNVTYLVQGRNISVNVDGKQFAVSKETHLNYAKILKAIRKGDKQRIADLVDVTKTLEKYVKDELKLKGGVFYWNGEPIHTVLAERILVMKKQGFPVDSMIELLKNLMLNPSNVAVNELFQFLEANKLPITQDGHFMAYKRVHKRGKKDYVDAWSKTIPNNIGDHPTMPRNRVDDDRRNHCSNGLHFCSLEYLQRSGYGGTGPIMIVKVNPRDVVSIPSDYNNQKGRCAGYEVVAKHKKGVNIEAFTKAVSTKW